MGIQLYKHQQEIIDLKKDRYGLFLGTGSGKTITALLMAEGNILIVCPKQQKIDKTWEKNAEKIGGDKKITVVSKEEFKKNLRALTEKHWDTLIIDEAHYFFSGISTDTKTKNYEEVPKTSQLYEGMRIFIRIKNPKKMYFLTATPASKPLHVYAIAQLLYNADINYFEFKRKYYFAKKVGFRTMYIVRKDEHLKENLLRNLKKMGATGQLSDWFDVPEQTSIVKYFEMNAEQKKAIKEMKLIIQDPAIQKGYIRGIENGVWYKDVITREGKQDSMSRVAEIYNNDKLDYIKERAEEFPKLAIFANYTGQVENIAEELRNEGYSVETLTGKTKDRKSVIENIEKNDKGIIVIQSSISEGYELKTVPVMIFASLSRKARDEIQGRGRLLRSDALKKNLYIYLISKDYSDESCYESVKNGVDFNEKLYENET